MDTAEYDPLKWTADFVRSVPLFCRKQLITCGTICVEYLQQKDYYTAGYALSGLLNGLNLLHNNTGLDLGYYLGQFGVIAGHVFMFNGGLEADAGTQEELREMAINCFKTALKDLHDDTLSGVVREMSFKLCSGMSIAAIINEIGEGLAIGYGES